jgi:type I restriction enzyme R subunit
MNWAKADNTLIKDLKDFTTTFFQKHTLLNVLLTYSVFDTSDTLLVMRPYQIAATERMLWKIESSFQAKNGQQQKVAVIFGTPQVQEKHLPVLKQHV